jgi:hypothetical protein
MRFKIIAERGNKSVIVPLSAGEIRALGDLPYMIEKDEWKAFKLNNIDGEIRSAFDKFLFLLHDVLGEGKSYQYKGKKFVLSKDRHYIIRKPVWRQL